MMATTTIHIENDNLEFVQELTKNKELSRIVNFLLRSYKEDRGYMDSAKKVALLEEQLKKKEEQYNALKREMNQ
ncbi:hypothetical protein [Acidiplasma sp.]|uniref:hypothetical protein n=1 Tax=Acidiplasma sp. TaxID=1872114 RepID=UPI0025860BFF|nr:hypothetical protein [Acidiplasma sp.]